MIRDWAHEFPTGILLTLSGIGLVGLLVAVAAAAPDAVVAIFGIAFLFGSFFLLLKFVVGLSDVDVERTRFTGKISDKYREHIGERLPPDHVAWTDSMEPTDSWVVVSDTRFRVSPRQFHSVNVGDDVTLIVRGDGRGERPRVIELTLVNSSARPVSDPEAPEEISGLNSELIHKDVESISRRPHPPPVSDREKSELEEYAHDLRTILAKLGIGARQLELTPFSGFGGDSFSWIELAEGPIRWALLEWDDDFEEVGPNRWCVPDSRIGNSFAHIRIHSESYRWTLCDELNVQPQELSQSVADNLTEELRSRTFGRMGLLDVETDPGRGCWLIHQINDDDEWTRPLWDRYQVLAETLLAMPLPERTDGPAP